jgi:hypothetical protein
MMLKRVLTGSAAVLAALGGLLLFNRSRRSAGSGGRGPDHGGGLAGVREPRRPVPPTLVDAAAAVPED